MALRLASFVCLFIMLWGNLQSKENSAEKDFILFSIPKCGSGLINKFLSLASYKTKKGPQIWFYEYSKKCKTNSFEVEKYLSPKMIQEIIASTSQENHYLFSHTNFCPSFSAYLKAHPKFKCILQIRDLRDACISLVYWKEKNIIKALGKEASFDQKLLFVICAADSIYKNQVFNLKKCAMKALEIQKLPNVITSRFEDLVGEKGGGDNQSQLLLIQKLSKELHLNLSKKRQNEIASILWGNDEGPYKPTFRQGQINKWKQIFKPEHKAAFKKYFGDLLIQLGYENDNDW